MRELSFYVYKVPILRLGGNENNLCNCVKMAQNDTETTGTLNVLEWHMEN